MKGVEANEGRRTMGGDCGAFLLTVITKPEIFPGEADYLEGLLEAGLTKLHLRKPGAGEKEKIALLERLAARWAGQLVWHGERELALSYGIPQVHGSVGLTGGKGKSGGGMPVETEDLAPTERGGLTAGSGRLGRLLAVSTSVHSWEEMKALPAGLAYAFISPLFDSISKPGYGGNRAVLEPPGGDYPCLPVGLGGIGADTIGEMMRRGWKGAAVLGWIWEEPREAVRRYERLKKITDEQ
jgi:thiamine-phosphate pyrophosphorylase